MLCDIYKYAKANHITRESNMDEKKIVAYIEVDEDGEFDGCDVVSNIVRVSCPDIGSEKQGSGANALCDKIQTIIPPIKDGALIKSHKAWYRLMEECIAVTPKLKPLGVFLKKLETDTEMKRELVELLCSKKILSVDEKSGEVSGTGIVTFRVEGETILDMRDWKPWLDDHVNNYNESHQKKKGCGKKNIISAITGEIVEASDEQKARIKGGPVGSGANVSTSGCDSFMSYGIGKSRNSGIGDAEAQTIGDAITSLIASPETYNSQLGLIFWYKNQVPNIIKESLNNDPNDGKNKRYTEKIPELGQLYTAALKGEIPKHYPEDTEFEILQFSCPMKERYRLRRLMEGRYSDLEDGLYKWYFDTAVDRWGRNESGQWKKIKSCNDNIYRILFTHLDVQNSEKGPLKEAKLEFGPNIYKLLIAMYQNEQIPSIFFERAIKKASRAILLHNEIDVTSIQVMKVYINRKKKETIYMSDLTCEAMESRAYSCGRLFATYGELQKVSENFRSIGNDVCSRYITMMLTHPAEAFVEMAILSEAHKKKISSEIVREDFSKKLASIAANINAPFPEKFTKVDQAEFLLGYYKQLNVFCMEKEERDKKRTERNKAVIDNDDSVMED